MLELHNLPKSKGVKKSKRIGRGNASTGNYSSRGMKGQKSRSGASGFKQRGIKSWLMKIPKNRGFKSPHSPKANVNLDQLDKYFSNGDEVTTWSLQKLGLIANPRWGVKVLGDGKLKKKLIVKVQAVSASARAAIEKAGGKIELTGEALGSVVEQEKKEEPATKS